MAVKIIATGSAVPKRRVTNDELSKHLDTDDNWIRTRTGIAARHIAEEKEDRLFCLSLEAAEKAFFAAQKKGLRKEDVDLVIAASATPDQLFPALSCRLQAALGFFGAAGFDLSLACTGFLAALQTAYAYLKAGLYRNILVVGADVMSRIMDWGDRSTAVLFGDGAGAVIVSAEERFQGTEKEREKSEDKEKSGDTGKDRAGREDKSKDKGKDKRKDKSEEKSDVLAQRLHAEGSDPNVLCCKAMYWNEREPHSIQMDGRKVFSFATKKVPEVILEVQSLALGEAEEKEKPKYYILHQANYRIIEAVAKRLSEPLEKFPANLSEYGNTTAASIPLLLDELNRVGKLSEGDLLMLAGFGAGLSYGAMLLRW